jgi:hypothetical protein
MSMTTRLSILMLLVATPAWAADVAVLPVQGTNLETAEVDAVGAMMAQAYAATGDDHVISPADVRAAMTEGRSAEDAALALGAEEYIETQAVRLASRIHVRAVRYSAAGSRLATEGLQAATLDDIGPVTERIAKALRGTTTAAATRDLTNITDAEGSRPKRVFTASDAGVRTGVIMPLASGQRFAPAVTGDLVGRFEAESWFLDASGGVAISSQAGRRERYATYGGLFGAVSANYLLTDGSIAPYVGGGFSPRLIFTIKDVSAGLAPFAQIGVTMLRQSRFHFFAEARVAQNVVPVNDGRGGVDGEPRNGKDHFPTEIGLGVGITF